MTNIAATNETTRRPPTATGRVSSVNDAKRRLLNALEGLRIAAEAAGDLGAAALADGLEAQVGFVKH